MTDREIQQTKGVVFNIQKYSVHDGPGIRTVVFLKGCPLKCEWCSNPESQSFTAEIAYNRNNCITVSECLRCGEICSVGALTRGEDDKIDVNWKTCTHCLACTDACPAGALITYGEERTVKNVVDEVEKDATFYARSGGGLTLGGGEPLTQPDFAIALLKEAKRRYIKTAIETCGHVSEKVIIEACKYINTVMFDIKSLDSEKHEKFTGQDNKRIISNIKAIRKSYPKLKIRVRTPVIPGFNDTREDIEAIVAFLEPLNTEFELLPYHRLGTQKYINTGREYPLGEVSLNNDHFLELREVASKHPALI